MIPRTYSPGDTLKASDLNALWEMWRALGKITGDGERILVNQDPAGVSIRANLPDDVWWLKLGSGNGSGAYAWTRQIWVSGTGWTASPGGETGTATSDPATEINANALIVSGTYVAGWRDEQSNALLFQLGVCAG